MASAIEPTPAPTDPSSSTPLAVAELGTDACAGTSTETANEGDTSTDPAADGMDHAPNAAADGGAGRTQSTPTRTQADHQSDLDPGHGTGAADAPRDGQDPPPRSAEPAVADVLRMLKEAEQLRANPDLDPLRKGRALTQFAHQALVTIERDGRVTVQTRLRAISYVQRMLADEREKLRANPDLDPLRRTRVLAEFVREDRRAIDACNRLGAEGLRGFDFAAMLEAAWKKAQPEIERKRRQYLKEQGDAERAEMSASEPDGRPPKP